MSETSKLERACQQHAKGVDLAVSRKSRGVMRLYCMLLSNTQGQLVYHANVSPKSLAITFRALADKLDPPKGSKPLPVDPVLPMPEGLPGDAPAAVDDSVEAGPVSAHDKPTVAP